MLLKLYLKDLNNYYLDFGIYLNEFVYTVVFENLAIDSPLRASHAVVCLFILPPML